MSLQALFGANLRHLRKARGLTQGVLAERIEISLDMVSKMERGAAAPSFDTIEKLCDALDTQPVAFFGIGLTPGPAGVEDVAGAGGLRPPAGRASDPSASLFRITWKPGRDGLRA